MWLVPSLLFSLSSQSREKSSSMAVVEACTSGFCASNSSWSSHENLMSHPCGYSLRPLEEEGPFVLFFILLLISGTVFSLFIVHGINEKPKAHTFLSMPKVARKEGGQSDCVHREQLVDVSHSCEQRIIDARPVALQPRSSLRRASSNSKKRPLRQCVRFSPNLERVYADERNGNTRLSHLTWYSKAELSLLKHKTIRQIQEITRYQPCFVSRLECLYQTCSEADLESDGGGSCCTTRLYAGGLDNLELIGLEKHVSRLIDADFHKRQESLYGTVQVIQSSYYPSNGPNPPFLWSSQARHSMQTTPLRHSSLSTVDHTDRHAQELRDYCRPLTCRASLFAQLLARAQLSAD